MFPDGGSKAWLCVAGGAACFFCSFGWTNCIGLFEDYYIRGPLSDYSPGAVSWITSLEMFFMLACGPVVGKLLDDYGPRYLLMAGTFLHVFGLMMASISTKYYQFLLSQGICSAIGASMIVNPAMACTATWFYEQRGWAIGLVASGSSIGGVVLPIVVSRLMPEVGFGWAMRTGAFIILTMMIFANLTVTSRIPPQKKPFEAKAFIRPFRDVPFLLTSLATFFFYWGMFVPFTYIVGDATSHGMSVTLAQYLVSIVNAGSIFGRTLPGWVGDKIGRFNTMIVMCFFTGTITLALWIPASSNAAIIVYAPLFGFSSGAAIGLTPALIAQISDVREIGARTGAMFGFASIAALTSAPIGGSLLDDHLGVHKYRHTKIWGGAFCLIGAVFYMVARMYLAGRKVRVKI